jgi:S-adenosylmethionine hydrolase
MIVLLTDFGQSEYVGVMKGVIYNIAPDTRIVDLCHTISPQNIIEASWILKNNYKYFPQGTIFCCVVDPGVGTERKALAAKTDRYHFVGPDNGLLWETLKEQKTIEIKQLVVPQDASRTFHGRDVFAKAAADIELGNFESTGESLGTIEKLELHRQGRKGVIVHIDRFGNIVTNLPKLDKNEYHIAVAGNTYTMEYYSSYDAAKPDEPFLIEGSNKTLEISLKKGNANDKLHLVVGTAIEISQKILKFRSL